MGPYGNQSILLMTQLVMTLNLFLTVIGWELSWICGFGAWLIVIIMSCYKVTRMVVMVSVILSLIASVGQFLVAGYAKDLNSYCDKHNANNNNTVVYVATDDHFGYHNTHIVTRFKDDDEYYSSSCNRLFKTYLAIGIITGVGWILSAVLAYSMLTKLKEHANSTRLAWASEDENANDGDPAPNSNHNNDNNNNKPTTTTEIIELPDGTTKIKHIVLNADGSQTVTETIETPKPEGPLNVVVSTQEDDLEKGG